MKTLASALLFSVFALNGWGQTKPKMIEVNITQSVDLKLTSYSLRIALLDIEDQKENFVYGPDYSEDDFYYAMDLIMDEPDPELLESLSPQERKEYLKEFEQEKENAQRRQREKAEELEKREKLFKPLYPTQLISVLKNMGFAPAIDVNKPGLSELAALYEENFSENLLDTSIIIVITSREMDEQIQSFLNEKPVRISGIKHQFESIDSAFGQFAEQMADRAKERAVLLAASMDKKAGPILEISTIHPGFSTAIIESKLDEIGFNLEDSLREVEVFDTFKTTLLEIIYRFEMLD